MLGWTTPDSSISALKSIIVFFYGFSVLLSCLQTAYFPTYNWSITLTTHAINNDISSQHTAVRNFLSFCLSSDILEIWSTLQFMAVIANSLCHQSYATQARGVLGSIPGSCRPFNSPLNSLQYECCLCMTLTRSDLNHHVCEYT